MPKSHKLEEPIVAYKGGHNDLGRWKQFGGTLERPQSPAPITKAVETKETG